MAKKQKDIFLEFEGDSYFERNHLTIKNREMGPEDPIILALSNLIEKKNENDNTGRMNDTVEGLVNHRKCEF